MNDNDAQIRRWNEDSGQRWVELERLLDRQLAPLGAAAMEALALRPGERVLDVGCGTGATTHALAERVGPSGVVFGVDVSRPMLARARARTEALAHVQILEADAQVAPLPAVDAVFSRFGVMFFAEPVAAFTNVRSALAASGTPAGRVAFVCWRALADNPVMGLAGDVVGRVLGVTLPAAPPRSPGPFAFAEKDYVEQVLGDAGFSSATARAFDTHVQVGDDLASAARFLVQMGPAGTALREQGADDRTVATAEAEVAAALTPYARDGAPWLPAAVWVVEARV